MPLVGPSVHVQRIVVPRMEPAFGMSAMVRSSILNPQLEARPRPASPAALEELHGALVLLRRGASVEGSQIASLSGLGVLLLRVQPIFPRGESADHGRLRN